MFLGVSGSVLGMEMTDSHRRALGLMFRAFRTRRFGDSRKAAYTAAGVNAATWTRLEQGLSVKDRTLATALRNLVPDTEGDWTRLNWRVEGPDNDRHTMVQVPAHALVEVVGGDVQDDLDYVSAPGEKVEGGASDGDVLNAITAMRRDMQAMEQRLESKIEEGNAGLSSRLDRLEQRDA